MDIDKQKIYSELRIIKMELEASLQKEAGSTFMKAIIHEELKDIDKTLDKLINGDFGLCESSGEWIPENLLAMIPTITSLEDVERIDRFYCKPINY